MNSAIYLDAQDDAYRGWGSCIDGALDTTDDVMDGNICEASIIDTQKDSWHHLYHKHLTWEASERIAREYYNETRKVLQITWHTLNLQVLPCTGTNFEKYVIESPGIARNIADILQNYSFALHFCVMNSGNWLFMVRSNAKIRLKGHKYSWRK